MVANSAVQRDDLATVTHVIEPRAHRRHLEELDVLYRKDAIKRCVMYHA
jgi:hypothetical protein